MKITVIPTRQTLSTITVSASSARKFCRLAFSLWLFIFCALNSFAQSQFDVWNTDQGLPQNSIQDILQTRDGYLWLTTSDGLVRFDGAQFTVFNAGNSPGLKSNRFTVLFEDRFGVLWAGTEDGGLSSYKDGAFVTYTVADGLPSNWVRQIQADPDPQGNLLVATDAGVLRWPKKEVLWHRDDLKPSTPHFKYVDREGGVWSYDDNNLYRVRDGIETVYSSKDGLLSSMIGGMYEDREGSIWISGRDTAVQRLRDGVFRNYAVEYNGPLSYVQTFYEDRAGYLWLGTNHDGLIRLSYSNDDARFDATPPPDRMRADTTAQGLSDNSVKAVYEDTEGSLWVGTSGNGVNRLRQQLITTYSTRDGLAANNVYPIYQDRGSNIWIGTWSYGLTVLRDGKFKRYGKQDGVSPGGLITALAEDRAGRLWIGGYGGACWYEDGKFTRFSGLDQTMLKGGGLTSIYQDGAGDLWFGTDAAGLYRYHNGEMTHFTAQDSLPSNNIHAILEDSQGNLWFATYGGLLKYSDDHFNVYTTRDGLASNRVRSLYLDTDGTLWVGTYDGGLSRYRDGRFTSYTTRDGLFNSGVFQILEDESGNLWMSCNLGIYRVSKRELNEFAEGKTRHITSIAYGKQDGMLNLECNGGSQPAGIRARDGKLWFPTQGGVSVVDPRAEHINSQPPPVVIESALVDRESRDLNQPLRIEPGQTNLEIHYTGLSFIKPDQVKFKYKLEGVDTDWVEAGNRRIAYYSHLPPGTYTFTVVAANSDGVWNTVGKQLKITIIPPLWQRWWFIALIIGALALVAVLAYRRRVARLNRARQAQEDFTRRLIESQESERKRIAAELHDSLGQSLIIIKNQALLSLSAPENQARAMENMADISATASEALGDVREIAYNLRPYQLDRLGLTKAIEGILDKVSASSRIDFSAEIDRIDGAFPKESEINVYRIVQESLNNIVKHSEATEARLEIKRDARGVLITIRDNGKGFVVGDGDAARSRRGLGLMGISERASMLGAKYEIHSVPGEGTTLIIRLGLENNS